MKTDVFKYPDTNSSRAGITALNLKFEGQKIAIIGVGGTGSYILDLISKTHIAEIHLYDPDVFQVHNAFRAPGACGVDTFPNDGKLLKVDYYTEIYSQLRNGIIPHPVYVDNENIAEFSKYDFVFISVDKNKVRSEIITALIKLNVPFIDVGMGVNLVDDKLLGTVRVTAGTAERNKHIAHRIGAEEFAENEYASNIQIVELNCFNATLAVMRWKKMVGFYQDLKGEYNNLFFINTGKLLNEDFTDI
jgi:hypothetical protein